MADITIRREALEAIVIQRVDQEVIKIRRGQ